jgi:hypothetical protein
MHFVCFLVAASTFLGTLCATSRGFPGETVQYQTKVCLYGDVEKILLEDGSIWIPPSGIRVHRGDTVSIEGWYNSGTGNEVIERKFIAKEEEFRCTLDSFVEIETIVVDNSFPFQVRLRVDLPGQANEGFVGGQLVCSANRELLLWLAENLTEEKLAKGTEVLILKNTKGNKEVIHPIQERCIETFCPIAKLGEPIRRKVVSVAAEEIVFKSVDAQEEYRMHFNFDEEAIKAEIGELEESPITSFQAKISYNPVVCKIEIETKEGQSIFFDLSNTEYLQSRFYLEDVNQEMAVELKFIADRELGDALELGSYVVGEEFLAYPLTFYPIKDLEKVIGIQVPTEIDLTKIEELYFLQHQEIAP